METTGILIVAADHPSLDGEVDLFLGQLGSTGHPFGVAPGNDRSGFRLAAVECGRIVGLVHVGLTGQLELVVAEDRRGFGIGAPLERAAIERARKLGYPRLSVRPASGRSGQHDFDGPRGRDQPALVRFVTPEASATSDTRPVRSVEKLSPS